MEEIFASLSWQLGKTSLDFGGFCVWKTSYGNSVGFPVTPTIYVTVLYQFLGFNCSQKGLLFIS